MLKSQFIEPDRIRYYSDEGYYIRQIETGILYEDAAHNLPCLYIYEETDELIPIIADNGEVML